MEHFQRLKERQRKERSEYSQALSIRVHRALSWLGKAEQCQEDDDAKFIFLWVAFNAAYAQELDNKSDFNEKGLYQQFIDKLVHLDKESKLADLVWLHYSGVVRSILNNEFILQSYWHYQADRISEQQWQNELASAKTAANKALANSDITTVLAILFSRLYTLRNQIVHGGATYQSSANRDQLRDCTNILAQLLPVLIEIMMDGKGELWGEPVYPLVQN